VAVWSIGCNAVSIASGCLPEHEEPLADDQKSGFGIVRFFALVIMLRFPILILAIACAVVAAAPTRASLDFSNPGTGRSDIELVVVEAPGCIYCHLFHRDVVPAYERSPRSKTVPMRFLDLNAQSINELTLDRPIESVPTVLVLKGRREIGRIPGYVGPMNFFLTIDRLLDQDLDQDNETP
jgi:thioredoxin-related protein